MRVVILGNGTWQRPEAFLRRLRKRDFLVACDGAYQKATKLGLKPQVLIGDFDSLRGKISDSRLLTFRFPREKNETDAELALAFALKKKPSEILWYSPFGGRWDHSFANLFLLKQAAAKRIPVQLVQGHWEIQLILRRAVLRGTPGERLSLISFSEEAQGVTARGLKYPLHGETLTQDTTRGISNVFTAKRVEISLSHGWLLALHELSAARTIQRN